MIRVVVRAQVDRLVSADVRQHQRRGEIGRHRLRQHHRKSGERPGPVIAPAEHGPPFLHADHQQQDRPQQRRPVQPQPRARLHEVAKALQDLGDGQPQNDRQQDGEIAEGVHERAVREPARRIREPRIAVARGC